MRILANVVFCGDQLPDGFALLRFQLIMDKARFEMTELKVTKDDLLEDYKNEKKRMRVRMS